MLSTKAEAEPMCHPGRAQSLTHKALVLLMIYAGAEKHPDSRRDPGGYGEARTYPGARSCQSGPCSRKCGFSSPQDNQSGRSWKPVKYLGNFSATSFSMNFIHIPKTPAKFLRFMYSV